MSDFRIIVDEELVLSSLSMEDAERMAVCANDEDVSKNVMDVFPWPYSIEDAKCFIGMAIKDDDRTLGIRYCGELIGVIGITPGKDVHRMTTEIGYWIGKDYWGKGIIARCMKKYVEYVFENYDFVRIYAGVFDGNIGSMRVLEKCGFVKEAVHRQNVVKRGEVKDSHMYALLRNDYIKNK